MLETVSWWIKSHCTITSRYSCITNWCRDVYSESRMTRNSLFMWRAGGILSGFRLNYSWKSVSVSNAYLVFAICARTVGEENSYSVNGRDRGVSVWGASHTSLGHCELPHSHEEPEQEGMKLYDCPHRTEFLRLCEVIMIDYWQEAGSLWSWLRLKMFPCPHFFSLDSDLTTR